MKEKEENKYEAAGVIGWCGLLSQNLNWKANAFSFLFCAMANINLKN